MATESRHQTTTATASDVSDQAWRRPINHVGQRARCKPNLLRIRFCCAAYICYARWHGTHV